MYSNCHHCGTFAQVNRLLICRECQIVDIQLIQKVQEIVRREGGKNVFEMAARLSIPPRRIFFWLENGLIQTHCFQHLCPVCGHDLLNGSCQCARFLPPLPSRQARHPEKFHSALRVEKRRENYWEGKSRIRKKQKRDIWFST